MGDVTAHERIRKQNRIWQLVKMRNDLYDVARLQMKFNVDPEKIVPNLVLISGYNRELATLSR